ncbi:MAG: hypothetical protein P1U40_07500 [Coxiellaceae bacterium]|nr:hypothetical protein [Coxiellaceae bacterium]
MRRSDTEEFTADLNKRIIAINTAVNLRAPKGSGHQVTGGAVTLDEIAGLAANVKQHRLDLIHNARSFLSVSTYKFEADSEEGAEVLAAIKDRIKQATESGQAFTLKIITNQRGGPSRLLKPRDKHQQLIYREIAKLKEQYAATSNIHIDIKPHDALLRDTFHQKVWLADNASGEACALLGSGDIWHASNVEHRRREMCTLLRGFLAKELLHVFNTLWQAGMPAAKQVKSFDYDEAVQQLSTTTPMAEQHDATGITTRGIVISKQESATLPDTMAPALVALKQGIEQTRAGEKISMVVSNINNQCIIDAIIAAVKRGVQFRFYADKYENHRQESRYGGGTNIASIDHIVSSLNPLYWPQLEIRWATRDDNYSALVPREEKNRYGGVHTKSTSFSWGMTLSGSSAYDEQANCSRELDIVMYGKSVAKKMKDSVFKPHFKNARDYFIDRAIELVPTYHAELRDALAAIPAQHHNETTDQQRTRAYELCDYYIKKNPNCFQDLEDFDVIRARDLLHRSTKSYSTLSTNHDIEFDGIKIRVAHAIQDYFIKHSPTSLSLFHSGGRHRAQQLLAALEKPDVFTNKQIARLLFRFLHYKEYKYNGITRQARLNPHSLNTYILKAILQVDKLSCDPNQSKSQVLSTLIKVIRPVATTAVNPTKEVPASPGGSTVSDAMSTPVTVDNSSPRQPDPDERRPSFIYG